MLSLAHYALRQIRIPKEFYLKIKNHCRMQHKKMFVFYEEVITWFLAQYAASPPAYYYASFKNGHCLSLWLKEDKIQKLQQMAKIAQVSDARVIATALILYLEKNGIFL